MIRMPISQGSCILTFFIDSKKTAKTQTMCYGIMIVRITATCHEKLREAKPTSLKV
jgi:hypothetical protein